MPTQYSNHDNYLKRPAHEPPLGVTHGSFSLPATALASSDDTIERLLAFAFDVLDLRSVEVRVYEPSNQQQDGGQ